VAEFATEKSSSLDKIPIHQVHGVGEKRAKELAKIGLNSVEDLLYYFPRRYLDRSSITKLKDLREGMETTVLGKIARAGLRRGRKPRFETVLFDGTGYLQCVWFNRVNFWPKIFQAGDTVAFHGKVAQYGGLQMVHPDFDKFREGGEERFLNTGGVIPLYTSSETLGEAGLDSRGFRRILRAVLDVHSSSIEETLPREVIKRHKLAARPEALTQIHFPYSDEKLQRARQRLKFDELFFFELLMATRRRALEKYVRGVEFKEVGTRTWQLVEQLPFQLTEAQKRVLREIRADMRLPKPMHRLVQGDVGSGKTMVALIAMLMAVENGYQAALMAPTEILAEQHYLTIHRFLEQLQIKVVLLIGGQRKKVREQVMAEIVSGSAQVIIGTHALIQSGVAFNKLALVVIDEQHRFGVAQRLALRQKGQTPDVLVMTATPIPRTLSMTLYGDLDVSTIDELPKGRKPIRTALRPSTKRKEIYDFIKKEVANGAQAYIVFPLVEESEKIDLAAATESYEHMREGIFSDVPIALLHGGMSTTDKEEAMEAFKAGDTRILVSTTVIEVGVDVPNATLMVIEHAERFGLTQLHQLRGRVGRGEKQSYCILIAYGAPSDEAQQRLQTMVETNDGFRIAETDLKLRGPGEFFGTRQHGLPEFRIADLLTDSSLLQNARDEAFGLLRADPELAQSEHQPTRRRLTQLFGDKLAMMQSG
jgi:ATP-dependent DNA helicase RecG